MKKIAVAFLALFMMATIASAQHGGGHGPGGGPEGLRGPGGPALVGSDGTLFVVSRDAENITIKAVRSTGTVAWTATVAEGHVVLSDGNLIVESAERASDVTVTTTLTAISTATGATAWTKTITSHAQLVPFSGGTYAIVTVPPATSGGTPTRSVIGISNSGSTLFTLAL